MLEREEDPFSGGVSLVVKPRGKEGMNKLKEELSKVLRDLSSLGSVNFRAE